MTTKSDTYVIADLHWGHKLMLQTRGFTDLDTMNAYISERWNSVVKPEDKVYVLGDWCINNRFADYGDHLNGKKVLIKGNHDLFSLDKYLKVFEDIQAYVILRGKVVLSHMPIHPYELGDRYLLNIHGHLHDNCIMINRVEDPRYYCVSAERVDYKPKLLSEVLDERLGNLF